MKAFLALSWPHLGLHLEISKPEIAPRKLSSPYLGHILKSLGQRFHQESFLDPILATSWASSRNLWARDFTNSFLDPILATFWASSWNLWARDFNKKPFLTLSWPHLGLHLETSRLEISARKLSWSYLGHILVFILKSLG